MSDLSQVQERGRVMGESAEDVIDGACCECCGVYFKVAHGYPVTCNECWEVMEAEERKEHQKAIYPEL